jgi:ribosomal protein L15E
MRGFRLSSPVVFLSTIAGSRYNWHYNVLRENVQRDYATLKQCAVAVRRHLFTMRISIVSGWLKSGLLRGRRLSSLVRQQTTVFRRNVSSAVWRYRLRVGFRRLSRCIRQRTLGAPKVGGLNAIDCRLAIRSLAEERDVFGRKLYID